MAKIIQATPIGVVGMLVDELGTFPQISAAPVTMAGTGQITMPLEMDLNSDVVCPIVEFAVNIKMTSPASNPSTVLSNIRSVKIQHSAIKDPATGMPKTYTLDTATLLDGALLAAALMSDATVKTDESFASVDPLVAGQASGSEVMTEYIARFALPFKLPAGHLSIVLNCQDISYNGTVLDFGTRRALIIAPRRAISETGAYIACDSRRIAGLSTFAFEQGAQMFAVVGKSNVNGGILDVYDATTNPTGLGQPSQIGTMTLTQVTEQVQYYQARLPASSNVEMVINIDNPIPRVNRPTPMSLSLFRYDVFY